MVESKKYWGAIDASQVEGFDDLTDREKNAVRMALDGLSEWQMSGVTPKKIKVAITPDNPFNFRAYVNVLHKLGLNVNDTLERTEDGTITFLPTPYDTETLETPSFSDVFKDFFGLEEK